MPLKKRNTSKNIRRIIIWGAIIILIALMIISFSPNQNVTEIVLFP